MKTQLKLTALAVALALSTISSQLSTCFAQGSLTPPAGAPAPVMKSLDQVEARTPLIIGAPGVIYSGGVFNITNSGSYYLISNLVCASSAIFISTNNVTLDLNGFSIRTTAASPSGTAITILNVRKNITIENGHIEGGVTNNGGSYSGPGFISGIDYTFSGSKNVLVRKLTVTGCSSSGINIGTSESSLVESCLVRTVGGTGIVANRVHSSIAKECGGAGISGQVISDCTGEGNTSSGIGGDIITNCRGSSTNHSGILASRSVQNSYGKSTGSYGIWGDSVLNSHGESTSGTGIIANTVQNCTGSSSTSHGISADSVSSSEGYSDTQRGISGQVVSNSRGYSDSGYGIYSTGTVTGSYGGSTSGTGIYAKTAAFCSGDQTGGTAIQATVANGCYAINGTNLITYKYNMP